MHVGVDVVETAEEDIEEFAAATFDEEDAGERGDAVGEEIAQGTILSWRLRGV